MAFEGPPEDRLTIRELVDSYGDAVTVRDADAWASLWAEDAVWALRGREIVGRTAIREAWVAAMANYRYVAFSAQHGRVRVDGDRASARCHTVEYLVPVTGEPRYQHGTYEDEMVRTGAGWRFARRRFTPFMLA